MDFETHALVRKIGAGNRARTGTGCYSHGILSPGRLPIPPLRHIAAFQLLNHYTMPKAFCQYPYMNFFAFMRIAQRSTRYFQIFLRRPLRRRRSFTHFISSGFLLIERDILFLAGSTESTVTLTISPTERTSEGCLIYLFAISEICTSPS